MTVYVIVQLKMTDRAAYDRYQARFFDVFKKFSGRLLSADENPAVVDGLDDVLHQRKPQPRPRRHAIIRLGSKELIEHKGQVLGRNPHAGVTNSCNYPFLGLIHRRFHRHTAPLGRVFHRVA